MNLEAVMKTADAKALTRKTAIRSPTTLSDKEMIKSLAFLQKNSPKKNFLQESGRKETKIGKNQGFMLISREMMENTKCR